MKKEYNELFNRISPQSSNEEFLSQILRKAEKMEFNYKNKNRHFLLRKIAIIVVAAIALSGFTVYASEIGIFSLIFNKDDYYVLKALDGEISVGGSRPEIVEANKAFRCSSGRANSITTIHEGIWSICSVFK